MASTLFLNWIFINQQEHYEHHGCRDEAEQSPDHSADAFDAALCDDRFSRTFWGVEACPTQEKGDKRTGNGGTKLLTHRTGREDKTRS